MKRFSLIPLVLLAAVFLSACASSSAARGGSSWPGLAADNTNAYLASGAYVYAVQLSDGSEAWHYPEKAGKSLFYATPFLTSDGRLLVGSAGSDHALISLDPATGKENWAAPFIGAKDRWIASPLVVNGTIYAPNNDGSLYALKLSTAELLWSLPISHSLWGAPATNGKLIFLSSLDHYLYAVDPQSHKVAWRVDLGGSVPGSPVLSADGSTVYVGSFASKVFALDAANGSIRWTANTKGWVWGSAAVDGETIYAGDLHGQVYALDTASGINNWPIVKPDGPVTANLLFTDSRLVVATESGTVYALDRDGNTVWDASPGGKIYTTPVASGDLILVSPLQADFLLAALNKDGKLVWKFTPGK